MVRIIFQVFSFLFRSKLAESKCLLPNKSQRSWGKHSSQRTLTPECRERFGYKFSCSNQLNLLPKNIFLIRSITHTRVISITRCEIAAATEVPRPTFVNLFCSQLMRCEHQRKTSCSAFTSSRQRENKVLNWLKNREGGWKGSSLCHFISHWWKLKWKGLTKDN